MRPRTIASDAVAKNIVHNPVSNELNDDRESIIGIVYPLSGNIYESFGKTIG